MTAIKPCPLPEPRAFKLNSAQYHTDTSRPKTSGHLGSLLGHSRNHCQWIWSNHRTAILSFTFALLALICQTLWLIADYQWINPKAHNWPYPLTSHSQESSSIDQTPLFESHQTDKPFTAVQSGLFTPRLSTGLYAPDLENIHDNSNIAATIATIKNQHWPLKPALKKMIAPAQQGHWFSVMIPKGIENNTSLSLGLPLTHEVVLFDITQSAPSLILKRSASGLENLSFNISDFHQNNTQEVVLLGYFKNSYPTLFTPKLMPTPKENLLKLSNWMIVGSGLILTGIMLIFSSIKPLSEARCGFNLSMMVLFSVMLLAINLNNMITIKISDPMLFLFCLSSIIGLCCCRKTHTSGEKIQRGKTHRSRLTLLICAGLLSISWALGYWGPVAISLFSIGLLYFATYYIKGHHHRSRLRPREKLLSVMLACFANLMPALSLVYLSVTLLAYNFGIESIIELHSSTGIESYQKLFTICIVILIYGHTLTIVFDWLQQRSEHIRLKQQLDLEALSENGILNNLTEPSMTQNTSESAVKRAGFDLKESPKKNRLKSINSYAGRHLEKVADYADIASLLDPSCHWNGQLVKLDHWIQHKVNRWQSKLIAKNLQLIVSIKPDAHQHIYLDEEKLNHIIKTLIDISADLTEAGNITLRLETIEDTDGKIALWLTLQSLSQAFPDSVQQLLQSDWQTMCNQHLSADTLTHLRLLLTLKWIDLGHGQLNVTFDKLSGAKYQIVLPTRKPSRSKAFLDSPNKTSDQESNREDTTYTGSLLLTYDAAYATTMAEQANALDTRMRITTSVKQAKQTLSQAKRSEEHFSVVLVDFSRDAESLQGFILELREEPGYDQTPIVLFSQNTPHIEYLAHIFNHVFIIPRPSYYPQLTQLARELPKDC